MDIDVTILIQAGLFLFLLVSLNALLFQPFLRLNEERFQKMQGAATEVARLEREAAEDREAYLARIEEARAKARAEREEVLTSARQEERKRLADVRNEIAQALGQSRDRLQADEEAAKSTLNKETEALARTLASKLLGREVA